MSVDCKHYLVSRLSSNLERLKIRGHFYSHVPRDSANFSELHFVGRKQIILSVAHANS